MKDNEQKENINNDNEIVNENENQANENISENDNIVEEENDEEESQDDYFDDSPTLEDYLDLKKSYQTLKAQKEHWRKKAIGVKNSNNNYNNNSNNNYITRDEAVLIARGYDEEDLEKLKIISNGRKLTEVVNDEMFIAWKEKKEHKKRAENAQLGSSSKSLNKPSKPLSEMTREEHLAYWKSLQKK